MLIGDVIIHLNQPVYTQRTTVNKGRLHCDFRWQILSWSKAAHVHTSRWRRWEMLSGIYGGKYNIWKFPKIMLPPKSSILIGFSIINHPFWGTPIFGNTHISTYFVEFLGWWRKHIEIHSRKAMVLWSEKFWLIMSQSRNCLLAVQTFLQMVPWWMFKDSGTS